MEGFASSPQVNISLLLYQAEPQPVIITENVNITEYVNITLNQTVSLFGASTPQLSTFVILACITAGSLIFIVFDCLCFKQGVAQTDIEVIGDFQFSERKEEGDTFENTKNFYESNVTNQDLLATNEIGKQHYFSGDPRTNLDGLYFSKSRHMAATQRTGGSRSSVELSNLFRKKISVVPISAMP